ncbi:MAG: transcription termination/antitermination protein NusG [Reyranellaceae bacterium]
MMAVDVKRLSEGGEALSDEAVAKALKARAATRRQQALLAAAGEVEAERRWAIIKVEPRRENDVDNLLSRAMIEHWLPLRKADQTVGGKRRGAPGQPVWMIAWPGYMMVKIADTPEAWHGVAGVKHVKAVLGVGEKPFFFDDDKLLKIKAELATLRQVTGPTFMFVDGERVLVTDGPFASFPGKVVSVIEDAPGVGRARVEVMIFGREVPVDLDLAQLAKL